MERLGCFLPRKPARPAGQEQQIRFGQGSLAIAPWNFFHHDCLATRAIDAPHRVKQKNQKSPERNELETALGELVVSGGRLMAARTNGGQPLARTHGDLNALVIGTETGLPVNESGKTVTTI